MQESRVAVIGAGVAGLACAARLSEAGIDVAIYDKGRGPGGRCSTRRSEVGAFDHGAAFFTARDGGFRERAMDWRAAGVIAPWTGRFVRFEDGERQDEDGEDRFVGAPSMNAFVRHEADRLGVQFGLRLAAPLRERTRWRLIGEGGQSAWAANWVVMAIPAEQAAALVPSDRDGGSNALRGVAATCRTDPTWTLMADLGEHAELGFDAATLKGETFAWVHAEASRPGRSPGGRIVAHADSSWSADHLEEDREEMAQRLASELAERFGLPEPGYAQAHRWRYARVAEAADEPFGLDENAKLATCGDWHVAPRIESAWVSGDALGRALAERLA